MKVAKIGKRRSGLRWFNHGLSMLVVCLAVYIFLWPFLPSLQWKVGHLQSQPNPAQLTQKTTATRLKVIPALNTLVIPRLDLTQDINEGPDISVLRKGIWRRPKTSNPEKGGNTVIVGHRFTYSGKSVFYNLDKVQQGDPLVVYWQGKEYDYSVTSIKVVAPTEVAVENNTKEAQLTLYTCTPLWNPKDRLVIIANPILEPKE